MSRHMSFPQLRTAICGAMGIILTLASLLGAQTTSAAPQIETDSDHDGVGDALEQRLLEQFAPRFMVSEHDCSDVPSEFRPEITTPVSEIENGTIYGQVLPVSISTDQARAAEIHYYHLWRRDCGGHGHPLDAEHVSVLVRATDTHLASAKWKAIYWYAAAHENTVCDVSQIVRASTLNAVDQGATVWISPGKHASYLNEILCQRGCGADRCKQMVPLASAKLINLGEPGAPMNGSAFIASRRWPLASKMTTSNFPPGPIQRLNQLPETDIAWFNPGRHPAQGIIRNSSSTEQALASSSRNSGTAISLAGSSTGAALYKAGSSTGGALSTASDSSGNALQKSFRHTRHALGSSARHLGEALHITRRQHHTSSL
jgi:hypothetical protein